MASPYAIIERFITIGRNEPDEPFPWRIGFFDDERGMRAQLNGNLEVPKEGATIHFRKVRDQPSPDVDWRFHGLSIHPLGVETRPVDLQWLVTPDEICIHDNGVGPKRSFSYALSVHVTTSDPSVGARDAGQPAKVFFDPQLVNLGGSGFPWWTRRRRAGR